MALRSKLRVLLFVLIVSALLNRVSSTVLIKHAPEGRAYGLQTSIDVSERIAVDDDGFVYIAGSTTPLSPNSMAWGDASVRQLTANSDIFIAKLTPAGDLLWVKREGSAGNDYLNDFKLAKEGLYFCGTTTGNLGARVKGESDAFIMKYSLNGSRVWSTPYQFGSGGADACNALMIDQSGSDVFVAGSTTGRLFGSLNGGNGTLEKFVAKFEEVDDANVGLKLLKGRQKGAYGSCSGIDIGLATNFILVMSTTWNTQRENSKHVTTYLNVYDRSTLLLHKLHVIRDGIMGSFKGTRMVTNNGSVYFAGLSTLDNNMAAYQVLKYNISADGHEANMMWARRVGVRSKKMATSHQKACIVLDRSKQVVYVGGIEDYDMNNVTRELGMMVTPFLQLGTDGKIKQQWQKTTFLAKGRERIRDIALNGQDVVMYTGVWSSQSGPDNALLGSFDSQTSSRQQVASNLATNGSANAASKLIVGASGDKPSLLLVLMGVVTFGALMFVFYMLFGCRSQQTDGADLREEALGKARMLQHAQSDDEVVFESPRKKTRNRVYSANGEASVTSESPLQLQMHPSRPVPHDEY